MAKMTKGQQDKQRSTKHTHKTKNRVTRLHDLNNVIYQN